MSYDNSSEIISSIFVFLAGIWFFCLIIGVFIIVCRWKIFKKAGKYGWEAIIPIYNTWVFFEIAGLEGWYVLLNFIPFIGNLIFFVLFIIANVKLSKCFGKPDIFAIGLIFLPVIFLPILAFDKSTYSNPQKFKINI